MRKAELKKEKSQTVEVEIFRDELLELLDKYKVVIKGDGGISLKVTLSKDARELADALEEIEDDDDEKAAVVKGGDEDDDGDDEDEEIEDDDETDGEE